MKYIPIVYCFDEHYVKYVAVSMYSAFKNSTTPITFYCIPNFKNDDLLKQIYELKEKFKLNVVIVDSAYEKFETWKVSHHITKAAYLRFLIPDLLPEDKAIYLDCDVIVIKDITEFYDIDLENNVIGGVWEKIKTELSPVAQSVKDAYFNSGSLLMDLKKMREINFLQLCTDFHNNHPEQILWHDQDIINHVLEHRKKELPNTWNFQLLHPMADHEWVDFYNAGILHYNGPVKPWAPNCHPGLSYVWWQYWHDMRKNV